MIVAGGAIMSGTKRKVEELGGHVLSAAVGEVVARTMSAVVGRYEARASMDDQLERLDTLAIMVHSAVEAAEGVHIRSWWLRRWLWRLRDAALDADEVLRLFRQKQRRRADEEETDDDAATRQTTTGNTVWSAAWRALRSAKSMLFGRDDDEGIERLSRMVAKLEREAMGLGEFLKVLDLEVRRSLAEPPAPLVPSSQPPAAVGDALDLIAGSIMMRKTTASAQAEDRPRFDHGLSSISHEEYVAGMRKMSLLIVRQHIRRALDWLWLMVSRKPPAAPPASRAPAAPDTDRLRELVAGIQPAVRTLSGSMTLDFLRKRRWLCRWSSQLDDVVRIAEYQLRLAVSMQAGTGGDGDGADVMEEPWGVSGRMRRPAAQDMETAAAHLEDFVTLTRFALASLSRPCLTASPRLRLPPAPIKERSEYSN